MKLKTVFLSIIIVIAGCSAKMSSASNQSLEKSENTNEQVVDKEVKQNFEVPPVIISELDKRFPGWKFQKEREDILKYLKESVSPDARPEFIKGDFDGNGEQDYAVLIEHGRVKNNEGNDIGADIHLIAFLQKKNKFEVREIENDYSDFLMFEKKGTGGYDFETDKDFTYKNDAIFSGIFEKGGTSYIYEKDRFKGIITSD